MFQKLKQNIEQLIKLVSGYEIVSKYVSVIAYLIYNKLTVFPSKKKYQFRELETGQLCVPKKLKQNIEQLLKLVPRYKIV